LGSLIDERELRNLSVPILVKIAPDVDEAAMDDIADVSISSGIEGLIVSNTTVARPPSLKSSNASESGGLSGVPLFALSTTVLRQMRMRVGTKLVLIGVGGVSSGQDAYTKIRAGASLVQLYTAFAYQGPSMVARIKGELLDLLKRDGFHKVADAVGVDVD
jgi:dihydroorotate dehydrogenase